MKFLQQLEFSGTSHQRFLSCAENSFPSKMAHHPFVVSFVHTLICGPTLGWFNLNQIFAHWNIISAHFLSWSNFLTVSFSHKKSFPSCLRFVTPTLYALHYSLAGTKSQWMEKCNEYICRVFFFFILFVICTWNYVP